VGPAGRRERLGRRLDRRPRGSGGPAPGEDPTDADPAAEQHEPGDHGRQRAPSTTRPRGVGQGRLLLVTLRAVSIHVPHVAPLFLAPAYGTAPVRRRQPPAAPIDRGRGGWEQPWTNLRIDWERAGVTDRSWERNVARAGD